MRNILVAGLLVAIGCSGDPNGAPIVDSHAAGSDGGAPAVTTTDVTCQTSVQTIMNADGGRSEYKSFFAVVSDAHPGDDVLVEQCDETVTTYPTTPTTAACPSGSTCTTTGAAYPTGQTCTVSESGQFVGGNLVVSCGFSSISYTAAGVMSGELVQFGTVKVIRR